MRLLREDDSGIGFGLLIALLLIVIGIAFIWNGLLIAGSGCVGNGLLWIGAGLTIGDFGGFVVVKHPAVLIAGGGGVVVLLVGAVMVAARLAC